MNQTKRRKGINYLVKVTLLGVISFIFMLIAIPMPPPISFVKLDVANAITLIGGFAFGPLAAVLIDLIRIGLNMLATGTYSAGIGELSALIIGVSFAVPASIFYKYVMHNKKGAIISTIIGIVTATTIAIISNYFMIIPFFNKAFFHGGWSQEFILNLCMKFLLPYNLGKFVLCGIVTILLYKRLSPMLKKYDYGKKSKKQNNIINDLNNANVLTDKNDSKENSNIENKNSNIESEKSVDNKHEIKEESKTDKTKNKIE